MKKKPKPRKKLPKGWDETRIRNVIDHYEKTSEKALAAEDDAAFTSPNHTVMVIPSELVPAVNRLLAKRK